MNGRSSWYKRLSYASRLWYTTLNKIRFVIRIGTRSISLLPFSDDRTYFCAFKRLDICITSSFSSFLGQFRPWNIITSDGTRLSNVIYYRICTYYTTFTSTVICTGANMLRCWASVKITGSVGVTLVQRFLSLQCIKSYLTSVVYEVKILLQIIFGFEQMCRLASPIIIG